MHNALSYRTVITVAIHSLVPAKFVEGAQFIAARTLKLFSTPLPFHVSPSEFFFPQTTKHPTNSNVEDSNLILQLKQTILSQLV